MAHTHSHAHRPCPSAALAISGRSLLLCGSVVIYVREGMRHKEFYEYGLISGVHYVSVDRAQDVPAMVRWLQQNDDYAHAVALAGRARMSTLDVGALTDFVAETLTQYASRQLFRPEKQPCAYTRRLEPPDLRTCGALGGCNLRA